MSDEEGRTASEGEEGGGLGGMLLMIGFLDVLLLGVALYAFSLGDPTVGTGILAIALLLTGIGVAAPAQAADYPPNVPAVTCSAKAVSGATKIKVNVNPNLPGSDFYYVRLQKKVKGGYAQYSKLYKTEGTGETRTINVGKGTWRFKCYSKAFPIAAPQLDGTSNSVKIKR